MEGNQATSPEPLFIPKSSNQYFEIRLALTVEKPNKSNSSVQTLYSTEFNLLAVTKIEGINQVKFNQSV